jgi:hypothetical protein
MTRTHASLTALAVTVGFALGCTGTVSGDRAAHGGACPPGETCSTTVAGLTFVGEALFDDGATRLGPIARGGRFDLGIATLDGTPLPPFRFEFEDGTVMAPTEGTGAFNDGRSTVPVDGWQSLRGLAAGSTTVKVVDAATGELFDQIEIAVVEIAEIRLTNAHAPGEPFSPGTSEALGVELIGDDGHETRAFDLDMDVTSPLAEVGDDPTMWDCFQFLVPEGVEAMPFTVTMGDVVTEGEAPVRP